MAIGKARLHNVYVVVFRTHGFLPEQKVQAECGGKIGAPLQVNLRDKAGYKLQMQKEESKSTSGLSHQSVMKISSLAARMTSQTAAMKGPPSTNQYAG